jgi:putative acetyltransferase
MEIRDGDFEDPRVLDLLRLHIEGMHASSPPGTCHVLDLSGLKVSSITFVTAWDNEDLLAMGAIKEIGPGVGEIKSMRTDPRHLRKGAGEFVLRHLLGLAASRGYRRVSLETGTSDEFDAALGLYRRHGFVKGEVFGEYEETPHNQFYHLTLGS